MKWKFWEPKKEELNLEEAQLYLQRFFSLGNYNHRQYLWDILSALRGPDEDTNCEYKIATTGVIRYYFLEKGNGPGVYLGGASNKDCPEYVKIRLELRDKYYTEDSRHFVFHVMKAFTALGLKWDEAND